MLLAKVVLFVQSPHNLPSCISIRGTFTTHTSRWRTRLVIINWRQRIVVLLPMFKMSPLFDAHV
ncbi:hypothetical protein BJV82DRAFT_593255 [Fennellomyces sp. T-0311]|nr:hypothetical protein BJV82DRAFT_593255 [Fennellomyces sp. T-0311]